MQELKEMELSNLHVNPSNPATRTPDKELIASIKDIGIRTPLLVKKNDKGYVIIAGERRFKAAQELKLKTVPVIIQNDMDNAVDATSLLLVDNLHRKNMNMYEEYQIITELLKTMTIADVAKKLNKGTTYIVRRTGLQNLITDVVNAIHNNMVGLTERIVFIFARLPKDIQKSIWEAGVEEYQAGGKKAERFVYDEEQVEDRARHESSKAILDGEMKAEDVFRVMTDQIGKVSIQKALDKTLDDKASLLPTETAISKEQKKAIQEQLKNIEEADQLSIHESYTANVLGQASWRKATDEDDEKYVKDGVLIDGPNAGTLVSYIKLNPQKAKKTNEKPKSEKQIAKERAERKEKIFNNKVSTGAITAVFNQLYTGFSKTAITQEMVDIVFSELSFSWKNRTLRQIIGKEAFSKVDFNKATLMLEKELSKFSPAHQILFVGLAQCTPSRVEEVAKACSINITTIRKAVSDNLKAEMKKAEDAKIAEKARKESDAKAKAKQKK